MSTSAFRENQACSGGIVLMAFTQRGAVSGLVLANISPASSAPASGTA